jgi:hypothetical protein
MFFGELRISLRRRKLEEACKGGDQRRDHCVVLSYLLCQQCVLLCMLGLLKEEQASEAERAVHGRDEKDN